MRNKLNFRFRAKKTVASVFVFIAMLKSNRCNTIEVIIESNGAAANNGIKAGDIHRSNAPFICTPFNQKYPYHLKQFKFYNNIII